MKHLIFVLNLGDERKLCLVSHSPGCDQTQPCGSNFETREEKTQPVLTLAGLSCGENATIPHFRPIFVFLSQPPERSCATRAKRCEALRALLTGAKTDQRKETLLKSADRFSTHYHFLFSSGVSFSAQRGSCHASTPLLLSRHMGLCTSPHRLAPSQRVSGSFCFFYPPFSFSCSFEQKKE